MHQLKEKFPGASASNEAWQHNKYQLKTILHHRVVQGLDHNRLCVSLEINQHTYSPALQFEIVKRADVFVVSSAQMRHFLLISEACLLINRHMRWRKVTLLGVGLLGGSLGMALRRRELAEWVHGYVRREASVRECLEVGAADRASTNLFEAVKGAELIVLCTPLAQMSGLARSALNDIAPGVLVTDVGSVKGQLVAELEPLFAGRDAMFIGSHPMAGSEKMGVSAARPDLFHNAVCVVTPTSKSPREYVSRTEDLWKSVGARTLQLTPEVHDELVARSSHLPHVLAAHLARYVLDAGRAKELSQLCANGFRDSTRIASGSPEMWRDIVMMNKEALKQALAEYQQSLKRFEMLLDHDDQRQVEAFFLSAKQLRDEWAAKCASPSPE